jgi:hypothetical protein
MARCKLSRPLFAVALAAPVALGGCATSTYGTGEAPEMALFREMTGGLLSRDKKEPIDYEPRAPLVMPADTKDLPQPVETASAADPNWPIDPSERAVVAADELDARNGQDQYRRLRPLAGALPVTAEPAATAAQDDRSVERAEYYRLVNRNTRQRQEFTKALAESKGYSRSERRYLTDPPLAYRAPADSAPTGEVETGVKKRGFLARLFGGG